MIGDKAPDVLVETRGKIKIVTLNRPKVGNALLLRQYTAIAKVFTDAAHDDNVKAVVLTGNGDFFSVGADGQEIGEFAKKNDPSFLDHLRTGPVNLTRTVQDFPKLSVALVNGPVVGYPAGLVTSFDLVFCSQKALWQPQFLHIGVSPEGSSAFNLVNAVGWQKTMDIFMSNRPLKAKEMVAAGIASRVLPTENFRENGLKIVEKMLSQASFSALVATKGILRETFPERGNVIDREAEGLVTQFANGVPQRLFAKKMKELASKKKRKSKL